MKDLQHLSASEKYRLIGEMLDELKLRKYSFATNKKYLFIAKSFLDSGLNVREFLLKNSTRSNSKVRGTYFALQFFFDTVLHEKFDCEIPLAKKEYKLPIVLSKEEVKRLLNTIENSKHQLIVAFLYYAGLRVSEIVNLHWEDLDFERKLSTLRLQRVKEIELYFFMIN